MRAYHAEPVGCHRAPRALTFLTARLVRPGDTAAAATVARQSGIYGQYVIPVAMAVTLLAGLGMVFRVGFRLDELWVD